jgi:antirestriction protein ArdC
MEKEIAVVSEPQTKDVYQIVTDTIIGYLEQGTIPWRKTWSSYGIARNFISGNAYQGINFILMNILQYQYPIYLTYKQAAKLGGSIEKGAQSHKVVYYAKVFKHKDGHLIPEKEAIKLNSSDYATYMSPRYYQVFNIEFVRGVNIELPERMVRVNDPIPACQAIIGGFNDLPKFDLKPNLQPAYYPKLDTITMPLINQFDNSLEYYNTLYHELIHATGHEKRLNRKGIENHEPFGSATYSIEELIAEIGASFLCGHSGIDRASLMKNNAAYINGWLEKLKGDKKLIFSASSQAKKAVEWILNE